MFSKKRNKMLSGQYDYYKIIEDKVRVIAKKKYKNEDEIFISRLYNLVLNLCNQVIYDYTYVFTKNDFVFILDNDINLMDLLNEFTEDVQKMRKRNRKS